MTSRLRDLVPWSSCALRDLVPFFRDHAAFFRALVPLGGRESQERQGFQSVSRAYNSYNFYNYRMPLVWLWITALVFVSGSASAQRCVETSKTCMDGPSTKNINGVSVTRDCWRYEYAYSCADDTPTESNRCKELRDQGCYEQSNNCIDRDSSGSCMAYTRANGPVFIKTAFAEKLDDRCATIAVTYFIENTLTRSGKRVSLMTSRGRLRIRKIKHAKA